MFYVPQPGITKQVIDDFHEGAAGSSINTLRAFHVNGTSVKGLVTLGHSSNPRNVMKNALIEGDLNEWGLNYRSLLWRRITPTAHIKVRTDGVIGYKPFKSSYLKDVVDREIHIVTDEIHLGRPRVRLASGVRVADVPIVEVFFTANGIPSTRVLNPGTDLLQDAETLRRMLLLSDLVVVNSEEFGLLQVTLDIVHPAQLFRFGPSELLVTEGVQGARLHQSSGADIYQPAYEVDWVDPTGTGDCFLSNFLSARLKGAHDSQALDFAAAAAALQATMRGGSSVPSTDDVSRMQREGRIRTDHSETQLAVT
jgi:sugar/nucleoside kinase (ribokinase family)